MAIGATLFSWLVMGAWRGWGYCLCTDYHFQIRRELGIHQGESSYTQLLLNQWPGVSTSRQFADNLTVSILLLILIATVVVWIRRPLDSHAISTGICKTEDENRAEPSGNPRVLDVCDVHESSA